jgi:flagellar biogenesis protein FliO
MDIDNSTIILILYCVLAFVLAFFPAYFIFPRFIRKMKSLGNTGKDVNKRGNIQTTGTRRLVVVPVGVPGTCVITRVAPHLIPSHSSL